jgi:hypothetical protein
MRTWFKVLLLLTPLLLLTLPALVQAQFTYTAINGQITITGYTGTSGTVVIPNTLYGLPVTSIGEAAFKWCHSLTNLTIGTNVISIGPSAFYECYSLISVTIPNSVTSIRAFAFCYCTKLTSVTIGTNVTTIDDDAFSYSALTNVTIPDSVTNIGGGAFSPCTNLTNLIIGTGLTNIWNHPFDACASLKAITVDDLNPAYSSMDGVLFNKNQTTLIQCPASKAGSYTIPNRVTNIGGSAFAGCTHLTSVTIPNNVTSIGDYAFAGCSSLTSVTIPNSVTSIGGAAFDYCSSLTSVIIGTSVSNIGSDAFADCSNLTAVYFRGNAPNNDQTEFMNDNNSIVYYLPGTTGWGSTFGGRIAFLWKPQAQSAGLRTNRFGFTITGNYMTVVVEACTNLANPAWSPISTITLTDGSAYFSDPQWTNYPTRFYRIRSP